MLIQLGMMNCNDAPHTFRLRAHSLHSNSLMLVQCSSVIYTELLASHCSHRVLLIACGLLLGDGIQFCLAIAFSSTPVPSMS